MTRVYIALRALEAAAYAEQSDADSTWWEKLSDAGKKAYKAAHPNSALGQYLRAAPGHVVHKFKRLTENTRQGVADWHAASPSEKAKKVGGHLAGAAKAVAHHVVEHGKHELHTYKGAAAAIGHLASGKKWKDLHPHHKKGLRNALIHAGITAGSMALGDATGASGNAVAHLAASFAAEHAHHAALLGAGEVALKSGKQLMKKVTASDDSDKKAKVAKHIAAILLAADIPTSEWIAILHEVEQSLSQQKGSSYG